ncbi:hypothetical protein CLV84_1571 [Neolewinella xylanilytica]|uniref:Outer membrane scaffolding protein for murein synthesis (MipA/OmpV family) n=1 Tax=Neolewinella xylanilytica TaxID=1514080 RepID=A0A2S6IAU9_9BACT|nr:hypothetical protein [Neolewinella xylanilytica]PPK88602.1 hypothetical protein CLV84_1571 [Neolewinella xylanilytica]
MNSYWLPWLLLLAPAPFVAQITLEPSTSAGTAWFKEEVGDNRGAKFSYGLGLHYAFNDTDRRSLGVEFAREDYGGFHIPRSFSQIVPAPDATGELRAVSMQTSYQTLGAYRLSLVYREALSRTLSRFTVGLASTLVRLKTDGGVINNVVQQSLDGEIVPYSYWLRESVKLEEGVLRRILRTEAPMKEDNQLHRYRYQYSVIAYYALSADLKVFVSFDSTIGALGKRYGRGGNQLMLGEVRSWNLGFSGSIFQW